MKFITRAASGDQSLPNTSVLSQLDNQVLIILRAWGAPDLNQKFIDEVIHYLSTTQADLDVTTPFAYQENLSALANRTRVALLLAHDYFYRNENKAEYLVGFEATLLFKSKTELAWSSVGRFEINKVIDNTLRTLINNGSDLDSEVLLPVQLIGVESEIDISSGSLVFNENDKIIISSTFKNEIHLVENAESIEFLLNIKNNKGVFWYSAITSE